MTAIRPDADVPVVDAFDGVECCESCGRESCQGHPFSPNDPAAVPLPADELEDAAIVAREGQVIAARGVPYLLDGIIPAYGMLGFLVAYAKVGKTTFGQSLGGHVATGRAFLNRTTQQARTLVLAAEDPPEYTAWLARQLDNIPPGYLTFRRRSLLLTPDMLDRIVATVRQQGYRFVLIASWQAVVRGLIRDENDNAGAVKVVEDVKAAARASGVPWLIDAHSGKGEDQADDADPSKAMRGASAAAGAADYTLSLRYANGAYGNRRRFSGKGRFVSVAPITIDYDALTGAYTVVGEARDLKCETTWHLIKKAGALDETPRSVTEIARICGLVGDDNRPAGGRRRQLLDALTGRPDVLVTEEIRRGRKTALYRLAVVA